METAVQEAPIGDKAVAATAEQFLKQARRRARKKFTSEEKIRIILEGMKREVSTVDLCRREGISTALYYSWLKDFMEAGKARLQGDTLRQANTSEIKALRREIEQLKELAGEQALQIALFKKSLSVSEEAGT
jgi:transposase